MASNATDAGSALYCEAIIGILSRSAWTLSCSIEAALKVSAAAKTEEMPFFFRKLASFAIEVVFPVPLMPKKIIMYGEEDFICSRREGGSCKTDRIDSFRASRILAGASVFFICWPTNLDDNEDLTAFTASKATLFSNKVISRSLKASSNCSPVRLEEVIFLKSFVKKLEGSASAVSRGSVSWRIFSTSAQLF